MSKKEEKQVEEVKEAEVVEDNISTEAVEEEKKEEEKIEESTEKVEKDIEEKNISTEVVEEKKESNNEEKDYLLEEYYRKKYEDKNKGISSIKLFFVTVVSFLIGGIVMIGLLKFTPILGEIIGTSGGTIVTKNETQVYEKGSIAASVEKVYDAVVLIQCYKNDQLASSGTGFVYKTDDNYGYILTNAHVVKDMEKVTVMFTNDEEADVEVLGSDSYLDLAVLKVKKKYVSMVANIGSSEKVSIGDSVFTVGSPMGYDYRGSVTSGVLSGKDRMVTVSVSSSSEDWVMRVLQIDASINPGNSGGPLLNVNGEVIGICSMKLVDSEIEGMGFAIPIEYAMNHVEQLEKGQEIEWPVLGVSMANLTDTFTLYRNNIRISDDITSGVVVVEATGAAKDGGIEKGDVITAINGKKTKNIAYLRYELYQHSAGEEVEITVNRNGKDKTLKVTLGKSS